MLHACVCTHGGYSITQGSYTLPGKISLTFTDFYLLKIHYFPGLHNEKYIIFLDLQTEVKFIMQSTTRLMTKTNETMKQKTYLIYDSEGSYSNSTANCEENIKLSGYIRQNIEN